MHQTPYAFMTLTRSLTVKLTKQVHYLCYSDLELAAPVTRAQSQLLASPSTMIVNEPN